MADERFVWRLDPQTQAFLRDIARANEATRRFGATSSQSLRRVQRGFDRARTAAVGFIGAFTFQRFLRETTDAVTGLQRIESALTVATGGVREGAQAFAFVREEADRLGLSLRTSSEGYAQLAAAARGTAIEGETTRELFLGAAEASTALGLSAEQTGGIIFALQQIMSKGVVSAEEIRRQLGDRLPGAFQIAARAIGVTTEELNSLLEQGQLFSADFLPQFARQLRSEFGDQAAANTENLVARLNRLETASFDVLNAVGRGGLTDAIGDLADKISEAGDEAEGFGEELGGNLAFILRALGETALFLARNLDLITAAAAAFIATRIVRYVLDLVVASRAAIAVAGGLGKALSANWVTLAATGIGAIVGVITLLAQRTTEADERVDDLRARMAEMRDELRRVGDEADAASAALTALGNEFSRTDALRALREVRRELTDTSDELRIQAENMLRFGGGGVDVSEGGISTLLELAQEALRLSEAYDDAAISTEDFEAAEQALIERLADTTGSVENLTGAWEDFIETYQRALDLIEERNRLELLTEPATVVDVGGDNDGGGGFSGRRRRDPFADRMAALQGRIEGERRLQTAVLESAEAIEAARTETELLADIRRIEAQFTGEQRAQLIALTNELYEEVEATERLMDATENFRQAQELVDELLTESADNAQIYAAALATLDELYNAGKISAEQYNEAVGRLNERFGKTNEVGVEVGKTLSQTFREIVTDINNAEAAAVSFLNRLTEIILQAAIFGPLENALAGAFGGGTGGPRRGGGRAQGGNVRAGRAYMVGENGPEPFIPTQDGIVLPNAALAAGGGTSVNLNMPITLNAQGADRAAIAQLRREFLSFRRDVPSMAVSAVARETKRGGGLAKTLKVRQ